MSSTAAFRIKRQKGGNTDLSSVLLSPPPLPQPCPIYQCLHTQGGMKTDHALSRPQMRFPFIWHCIALEVCFEGKQSFNAGLVCVVSVWKHSAKESPWRGLAALLSLSNEFSLKHQIHTWQFWGRSLSLLLTFFKKKKISHLKNKNNPWSLLFKHPCKCFCYLGANAPCYPRHKGWSTTAPSELVACSSAPCLIILKYILCRKCVYIHT